MPNIFAWLWFFSAPLPCWDYCKSLPSKRQIALYSPGWLASPFILLVQIISPFSFSSTKKKYFPSPNIFFLFLLRFSSPPQKRYFSSPNIFFLFLLHCLPGLVYQVFTQFPIWANHYPHDFSAKQTHMIFISWDIFPFFMASAHFNPIYLNRLPIVLLAGIAACCTL